MTRRKLDAFELWNWIVAGTLILAGVIVAVAR